MNEPDRRVVVLVAGILGVVSVVGLVLTYLVVSVPGSRDGAAVLAALVSPAVTSLGLVATRGTRQSTAGAVQAQGEATGYQQAVDDLRRLAPPPAGVVDPGRRRR